MNQRQCKAAVRVMDGTSGAWLVAETPTEVEALLTNPAASGMVRLTLANSDSDWNGRALFVRATAVKAISPPVVEEDEDE